MKHSILKSMTAATAVSLILSSASAWAGRVPDNMISGTVSAEKRNTEGEKGK